MLNDLIIAFKKTDKIPEHLLQVADSLRLLGNVPGAHPAEIPGYQFTRYDAEFGLASALYFNEQYFTKIDKDVSSYYSLEIDLSECTRGLIPPSRNTRARDRPEQATSRASECSHGRWQADLLGASVPSRQCSPARHHRRVGSLATST
jgi:hypothetical protein